MNNGIEPMEEHDSWGGANTVDLTSDGGYFILGTRGYYESNRVDLWVIKTNQYGDEQWNKTFGGIEDDYGSQAYQTSDGGYIILGNRVDSGAGRCRCMDD